MNAVHPNVGALAAHWWVPIVRGIAAVLFGILAIVAPSISLLALILFWGAYALIDGGFNLVQSIRSARAGRSWGWLLFEGILSIAAGIFAFAYPGMTALVLLTIIAVWAVLTGIAEIAAAIRLRRVITNEWMLAVSGVLSILLGVLLFVYPVASVIAIAWMIGVYAILFGLLLIGLGVRLNRWHRSGERPLPPSAATPTPA